jgi:pimeloyl-ACP methyl ester carboxylesterase
MVVGHSAATTLAWQAADPRPDKLAAVVLTGGFPAADGDAHADQLPERDGVVPFPGWEPFEGPDAADLDDETRQRVAAATVAVPGRVAKGVVRLGDDRRFDVPVVLICPEFTPAEARAWIDEDPGSELARVKRLDLVDIDSGHWPMFTKPAELARLLADAADSV